MSADAVLLIFDLSIGWTKDDEALLEEIPKDIPLLIAGNKTDIQNSSLESSQQKLIKPSSFVSMSAVTGEGEENLINTMLKTCGANQAMAISVALNERQRDLAELAVDSLYQTAKVATEQLPWDFWTIDLREAIHKLGEVTGNEITEALLERIFSRFCIGK